MRSFEIRPTITGLVQVIPDSPNVFAEGSSLWATYGTCMPEELDVRDLPPPQRHPEIHEAFESLDSGEALTLINDHDPKPLFYEMRAERDDFDAEGYEVERRGENEFVATLPKQ